MWVPVERSWRLNERHYGALQGLNKAQTVEKHGAAQVKIWRRSYDIPPPALAPDDPRHPRFDPRYAGRRTVAAARHRIAQGHARAGAAVLGGAHRARTARRQGCARGRAWQLPARHGQDARRHVRSDIVEFNIPTGVPMLYELDDGLAPRSRRFLGDPDAVAAAQDAVRRQTEKK